VRLLFVSQIQRRRNHGPSTDFVPPQNNGQQCRAGYLPLKAAIDSALALALLVLASPIILLGAILVKLSSRGPAFYSQTRVGKQGRLFRVIKLRTMVHNCEAGTGPCWSRPGDPRITPLGRFLRNTHLDELPQLWNVLRGEMSLVGPRPERPEFLPALRQRIPNYQDRLLIRPGITGLAQVQLPADSNYDSVRRKLRHDLFYMRRMGLWLDFKILVCTAAKVLGLPMSIKQFILRGPGREAKKHLQIATAKP
jgi:lipopolysaccharide/colanic/teichoic acid biosynthesis glycosyltransferase